MKRLLWPLQALAVLLSVLVTGVLLGLTELVMWARRRLRWR